MTKYLFYRLSHGLALGFRTGIGPVYLLVMAALCYGGPKPFEVTAFEKLSCLGCRFGFIDCYPDLIRSKA
jgi:hypothetical protein